MAARGEVNHRGARAPFICREMERRGREAGGPAVAGGAPLIRQLLEEETTRWPFDEGELKRRRQHTNSATRAQRRAAHGSVQRDGRAAVTSVTECGR
jgi:hypothetical protein